MSDNVIAAILIIAIGPVAYLLKRFFDKLDAEGDRKQKGEEEN